MKMNCDSRFSLNTKKRLLGGLPARYCRVGALGLIGTAAGLMLLAGTRDAKAYDLYSGVYDDHNVQVSLDFTAEYSTFYRVNDPSAVFINNINADDGDRNFRHGFVDNDFDLLPVFDAKIGNFGVHVSGETYINPDYLEHNQNNSPGTFNPISTTDNRSFTSATRNVSGENAILLDAFAYDSVNFGANNNQEVSFKFGRQTLLWGQSLFFATNGISAGQAPLDYSKAESLPNAEAQQVFLPVGQAVLTYQPNQALTFQAYYQFEWKPDSFEGVGSYFSSSDILDKGGQRLLFAPGVGALRIKDNRPPIDNGQFGASIQATLGNYDLGLYALRYDAKAPEIYLANGGANYFLVYPRDIQIYGTAFSTTVGPVNVGGEVSGRRNMPLFSGAAFSPTYPGAANAGALYAVGSTVAGQVSALYVSPGIPFDPGGVGIDAEYAMNHLLSVTSGKAELMPDRDSTAGAFEVVVTPTYYEAIPNTTLQFPIGLTYGLFGRSQIDDSFNHGTGSISVGVTATYKLVWIAGLTYHDYLGAANSTINALADRGYVSFNISHTF